jgi:dTDP-4-amino-4,6-dideoxygalactose transaminase
VLAEEPDVSSVKGSGMSQSAPRKLPLTKPFFDQEEIRAAQEALAASQVTGNGPIARACEEEIKRAFEVKHAFLTTSCTHAMELAMMCLRVGPGDEVICPSFTFPSTANAILREGARPIFADIEERTLNVDPADVERKITPRTRAILPVHYAGVACRMDELLKVAQSHGLAVVEDAAHCLGAKYKGKYLGTIGDIGCYSFHGTKNLTCGEGGAFCTNDDALAKQAEIPLEKGTNRAAFLRGQVDKYTWVERGSSFVLSDLLAAVLLAQLAKRATIEERRRHIWHRYKNALERYAVQGKLVLPAIPEECEPNWHIFYILLPDEHRRNELQRRLNEQGIGAVFHYVPLHSSPYGTSVLGCKPKDLPVTERVSKTLLRLPLFPDMTEEETDYVIAGVCAGTEAM